MKNLKIGRKFLITFGIILALFTVVAVFSIVNLSSIMGNFTTFYERPYKNVEMVAEMRRAIQSAAKNIGYATMTEDTTTTKMHIDAGETDINTLNTGIEFLYKNFMGDMALIDGFKATIEDSLSVKDRVFADVLKGDNEEAIEIFFNEYQVFLLTANEQLLKIAESAQSTASGLYDTSESSAQTALILVVVIAVLTFIVTIALALYLTKSLKNPISEIERAAKRLSEGDLTAEITYTSKDELGSLSESTRILVNNIKAIIEDMIRGLGEVAKGNFNISPKAEFMGDFVPLRDSLAVIVTTLSDTLGQINKSAEQVSSGSEQVSSGAQALSQGATEQASSIEELSATITEISSQITDTAKNAVAASEKVNRVGTEIGESNRRMQDMLAAMNNISSSSTEIGKIIKTIEDIAFQTNILALNAAVEAARAGAAGKGFAVVADEVRNLASKSSEASKNTAALIAGSLKAVENGTKIADETAHSLVQVVQGVGDVTLTIAKISDAAKEQAQAISQVTVGVDQISSVVQTNSATAEESAAASEELSGQAAILKGLMSKFVLLNSGTLPSSVATQAKSSPKADYYDDVEYAVSSGAKY